MGFLLFFKFTLFLTLADVRLEIFKLLLSSPFALLIIVDGLRDRLYRSVTNRNKDRLIIFALFFSLYLLAFFSHFPSQLTDAYLVFNHFFTCACSLFLSLFIIKTVLWEEKSSSYVGFIRSNFGFSVLHFYKGNYYKKTFNGCSNALKVIIFWKDRLLAARLCWKRENCAFFLVPHYHLVAFLECVLLDAV